jgi:hypothetical protein
VVLGEGREEPAAIVLSTHPEAEVRREMSRLDPKFADFARVRKLLVIASIGDFRRDYYTVTGRPRRQLIERDLAATLYG